MKFSLSDLLIVFAIVAIGVALNSRRSPRQLFNASKLPAANMNQHWYSHYLSVEYGCPFVFRTDLVEPIDLEPVAQLKLPVVPFVEVEKQSSASFFYHWAAVGNVFVWVAISAVLVVARRKTAVRLGGLMK